MVNDLISAICLCMVIEGLLPFINPKFWKRLMIKAVNNSDKYIRFNGLALMLAGALFLYLLRN